MEEWQNPDSGYLNCIGVGDTYVKRQLARILNENTIKSDGIFYETNKGLDVRASNLEFVKRDR